MLSNVVYRMYDEYGTLLYVGKSGDFMSRLEVHAKLSNWFSLVTSIRLEKFDSREEMAWAEREAIIEEMPLHNMTGKIARFP